MAIVIKIKLFRNGQKYTTFFKMLGLCLYIFKIYILKVYKLSHEKTVKKLD